MFLAQAVAAFIGSSVVVLSTIVAFRHWRSWRRTPGRAGLLPLHVWLIALSYIIINLAIITAAFGSAITWRAAIYLPGQVLGLGALFVMVNFQSKNRERHH